MNTPTFTRLISPVLLALLAYAPATYAATRTANMTVEATVAGTCNISANTLNFGTYDGNPLPGSTNVKVTCTANEKYDVGLNMGAHESAGVRQMAHNGDRLKYYLYSDASYITPVNGSSNGLVNQATGSGTEQTYTVYGRISRNQIVPSGTYQDTVVVTVSYI